MAGRPKLKADLGALEALDPQRIYEALEGGLPLPVAAKNLGVSKGALQKWIEATPERTAEATRARARAAHTMAAETVSIADETAEAAGPADTNAARLRIQSRQWLAGKWAKEAYGDNTPQVQVNLNQLYLDALRQANAEENAKRAAPIVPAKQIGESA